VTYRRPDGGIGMSMSEKLRPLFHPVARPAPRD